MGHDLSITLASDELLASTPLRKIPAVGLSVGHLGECAKRRKRGAVEG